MDRVSIMGISLSQGLKKSPKISPSAGVKLTYISGCFENDSPAYFSQNF